MTIVPETEMTDEEREFFDTVDKVIEELVTLLVSSMVGPHPELAEEAYVEFLSYIMRAQTSDIGGLVTELAMTLACTVIKNSPELMEIARERGLGDIEDTKVELKS